MKWCMLVIDNNTLSRFRERNLERPTTVKRGTSYNVISEWPLQGEAGSGKNDATYKD